MLKFFKRLFGTKPAEVAPASYKVEAPAKPSEFPFPSAKPAKSEKKPVEKKPNARKPRRPRKPQTSKV
jgi:hypothetical protein